MDTRKSRSGIVFKLGDTAIEWESIKQQKVALSTCEAEYYALCEAGQTAKYLNGLIHEMINGCPLTEDALLPCVNLFEDNQSCIKFSENDMYKSEMKHIDIRHFWLKEEIQLGHFKINYIQTHDQPADILTKPLGKNKHRRLTKLLGVVPVPCPERR